LQAKLATNREYNFQALKQIKEWGLDPATILGLDSTKMANLTGTGQVTSVTSNSIGSSLPNTMAPTTVPISAPTPTNAASGEELPVLISSAGETPVSAAPTIGTHQRTPSGGKFSARTQKLFSEVGKPLNQKVEAPVSSKGGKLTGAASSTSTPTNASSRGVEEVNMIEQKLTQAFSQGSNRGNKS
jgi:hypothetical protein